MGTLEGEIQLFKEEQWWLKLCSPGSRNIFVSNKNLISNLRPHSYSSLALQPWEPLALLPLRGKCVAGLQGRGEAARQISHSANTLPVAEALIRGSLETNFSF